MCIINSWKYPKKHFNLLCKRTILHLNFTSRTALFKGYNNRKLLMSRCGVVVYRLYKLCLCFDLQINHTINNNPTLEKSKLNIYKTICDSLLTLVLTGCIIKSGFRSASVNCRRLRPIVNRQREDNELLCYHRLPRDKNVQLKDHFWSLLKITK